MADSRHLLSPSIQRDIEELEDLYEHAPCGYLSLEPDGRIGRVNATLLAWTGHSLEEVQGRKFQDLLNIAGKIYYETHFAPLLRMQGFFNEVAFDLVSRSGETIPVLVNAVERRDEDDKPAFIRVTIFNASDRRRYERELLAARNALASANQELRAFYDTLPVGIFRIDASGNIVQASRRFCTLLGIVAAEDWLTAISAGDCSATVRELHRVLRTGEPFSIRLQVAGDDATSRHIEMKAVPISESGDRASTFVGVVEDVTEQVHADAQRRVIDRQLAISQITGGLAHNLNNTLAVIMGNLEILKYEADDRPALRQIVDDGLSATEGAAALVRRLLVYAGYSIARPDNLAIDPCLQSIAQELVAQFGQRHQLTCDLRAPGAVVEIDAGMLKEAVEELVANAVAAMPDGGEIRLSTRSERKEDSSNRRKIIITVIDKGIGMDDAMLAKAREPFFTTREVGQGIGLGLSLVDGISRIFGGELRLRSHPGTGTTVEMHLPAAD